MNKPLTISILGVTLAAAAAGCAGRTRYSTAVPVLPVAEGVAATTVRYDLHVNQAPAGTVTISAGTAEREARHDHVVRLTVGIDNRTRDRRFVLPLSGVALRDAERTEAWTSARLIEVDRQPVPDVVAVEPGQVKSVTLAFALPQGMRVGDLDRASLAWTLVIEDPSARERPVQFARATALVTDETGRVYGAPEPGAQQNVAAAPSGMLPASGQELRANANGPRELTAGTRGNQPVRATKEKMNVW
jgi:hypothetical protein